MGFGGIPMTQLLGFRPIVRFCDGLCHHGRASPTNQDDPVPAIGSDESTSTQSELTTFLYVLFGCIGLVAFGGLLLGSYVINDSSYLLWRDAKVELLVTSGIGAATRWRAVQAVAVLGAAVACFAVVVSLHTSIRRRSVVTVCVVTVAVIFSLAIFFSPASPYR
jgi:hypothetical protein